MSLREPLKPFGPVCGRPVYRGFNVQVSCWLVKGHRGPCR